MCELASRIVCTSEETPIHPVPFDKATSATWADTRCEHTLVMRGHLPYSFRIVFLATTRRYIGLTKMGNDPLHLVITDNFRPMPSDCRSNLFPINDICTLY